MKKIEDFIYLPKFKLNDILNTGESINGQAILTKKYFFILPDKTTDAIGMSNRDIYNKEYFTKAKENFEKINLIEFETEMVNVLPPRYVIPFVNFERFNVHVGFFIFGSLKFKRRGERITSAYIGNTANRKLVNEFYMNLNK